MKILHIISSGGMYGAEAVILNMSRILNESGHTSLLGVFSNSNNPNLQLHARALFENIESHPIPCQGQLDLSVSRRIYDLATQTGANVVHAHGYKADIYSYFALRRSDIPLVSTCHTWYDNDFTVYIYGVVDRWVLRKFDAVVAVSNEVRQRLLHAGVPTKSTFHIRNGVDGRPFQNALPSLRNEITSDSECSAIIGLVGRLSQEKGVDIFLRAAARVVSEFPAAHFVVVGEGPDRDTLKTLITELKIEHHAHLIGRRDDMPSVYASLDILVSSSRAEGLPMSILEGMASGRAVLATPVGEVSTVVVDGKTGVLVPAENAEHLASAIIDLLRSPDQRAKYGDAARNLIQKEFSAERMTADYLQIYSKTIQHKLLSKA